jgi:acid stress chaperone HdeB
MNRLIVAAMTAFVLMSVPAQAQKLDLNVITCKQFLSYDKENIGLLLMWMDAYFRDEDDAAVIDFDRMKTIGGKLGEACAKEPGLSLVTVAEPIYDEN